MGTKIIDQYIYLHFAVGIIAYFWNLSLKKWLMIHTIFEIFENTQFGINLINNISIWPGGKPKADTFENIIGDTIGTTIGWLTAYYIDNLGNKYGWYDMHIK